MCDSWPRSGVIMFTKAWNAALPAETSKNNCYFAGMSTVR